MSGGLCLFWTNPQELITFLQFSVANSQPSITFLQFSVGYFQYFLDHDFGVENANHFYRVTWDKVFSNTLWMGSIDYERLSGENPSPLRVVFTLGKNNYERWEKIQKWSFHPTAQSRFKPGQKQLWAVSNVCRSNDKK